MKVFKKAQEHYEEALILARSATRRLLITESLNGLGNVAYCTADYAGAHRYFHESLTICRKIGWQWGIAHSLNGLGRVAVQMSNETEARQCLLDALQIGLDIHVPPMILATLTGIADLLAMQGNNSQAVELLSLVLHHRATHAETRQVAQRLLADIKANVLSDVFASAQQRGQDSDLETIARQWLFWLASPQSSSIIGQLQEPLTRTEQHVLSLMQSDLSYREIAVLCHVSLNTIKTHRRHIFNKLNVHSRDEAIQKARDLHLL